MRQQIERAESGEGCLKAAVNKPGCIALETKQLVTQPEGDSTEAVWG